jgi:hypothetical protein
MGDGADRVTTLAAAVISSAHRWGLVRDQILPAILQEPFDEVILAGDGESGTGYRHLAIPALTGTTVDALVKRDAAALATESEYVAYFSDDHRPVPGFAEVVRGYVANHTVDILIPERVTWREVDGGFHRYNLNSGAGEGYCGGHAGVFHRAVMQRYPWTTAPHDRLWDLYHSRRCQELGFQFHCGTGAVVEDVEHLLNPEAEPWR